MVLNNGDESDEIEASEKKHQQNEQKPSHATHVWIFTYIWLILLC